MEEGKKGKKGKKVGWPEILFCLAPPAQKFQKKGNLTPWRKVLSVLFLCRNRPRETGTEFGKITGSSMCVSAARN